MTQLLKRSEQPRSPVLLTGQVITPVFTEVRQSMEFMTSSLPLPSPAPLDTTSSGFPLPSDRLGCFSPPLSREIPSPVFGPSCPALPTGLGTGRGTVDSVDQVASISLDAKVGGSAAAAARCTCSCLRRRRRQACITHGEVHS